MHGGGRIAVRDRPSQAISSGRPAGPSEECARTVGGNTTTFTWDIASGLRVVLDDGNQYVYGAGLVSMKQSGSWYYYLVDGLNPTMAIVDSSGNSQKSYQYDVYGDVTGGSGSLANEFDFAGQQTDGTGLQYLRARYYDPETGTFLSREPLATGPSWTGNTFGYVDANPARFSDPSGRMLVDGENSGGSYCYHIVCGDKEGGGSANHFGVGEAIGGALAELWDQLAHWADQMREGLMRLGEYGRRAWDAASKYLTNKFNDPLFRLSVLAALAGIGVELSCGAIPATAGASAPLCAGFIVTAAGLLSARANKIAEMRRNGEIGRSEASCEVISDVVGAAGMSRGAFIDLVVGELSCDAIGARFD